MNEPLSSTVKSAGRVLDILEHLAASGGRVSSQADLGRQLGIPKSSLHALLRLLAARGYVEHEAPDRAYRLGPRTLGLGHAYAGQLDLVRVARPILAVLARLSAETITLDTLHGNAMLTLAREHASHPFRIDTRLGWPFAAHASASGKVMLASLDDEALQALLPGQALPALTGQTVTSVSELRAQLAEVRRSRVAYNHGELFEGVDAVAVPVSNHLGAVVAALGAVIPSHRASASHLERVERLLQVGARLISGRLGSANGNGKLVVDPETYLQQIWERTDVVLVQS